MSNPKSQRHGDHAKIRREIRQHDLNEKRVAKRAAKEQRKADRQQGDLTEE